MNTTSMLGNHTCNTYRLRMRKLESNLMSSPARLWLKKPSSKNKQQEQNSMSLQQIFITCPPQRQFQVSIILHIHRSNHRHLM